MMLIRYYFWVLVFHLVTFYKQMPISFLWGLVSLPYFFMKSCINPASDCEQVIYGIDFMKQCWKEEVLTPAPKFVVRRFEALRQEALNC